ncbi:hypothetical protein [Haliea sp. E17]|uniref:hypothetical protein n=1 Tax=Haliea sp. E17 TaxID=3401576 RepID=UPI003AADC702
MTVNVLETEWWTLELPPEWWADSEEESILIGDRDDVGCIEISTLHRDSGVFSAGEVAQIAEDGSEQRLPWKSVNLGEFSGVAAAWEEEGAAIREWCVADAGMLLFITYSCDVDHRGLDDAAVDAILATLRVLAPR